MLCYDWVCHTGRIILKWMKQNGSTGLKDQWFCWIKMPFHQPISKKRLSPCRHTTKQSWDLWFHLSGWSVFMKLVIRIPHGVHPVCEAKNPYHPLFEESSLDDLLLEVSWSSFAKPDSYRSDLCLPPSMIKNLLLPFQSSEKSFIKVPGCAAG